MYVYFYVFGVAETEYDHQKIMSTYSITR